MTLADSNFLAHVMMHSSDDDTGEKLTVTKHLT